MKNIASIALVLVVGCISAALAASAQTPPQKEPSTPILSGEAPQLARAGTLSVGTNVATYIMPRRPKITLMGAVTGNLPLETRSLDVRFWYPATFPSGATRARYRHEVVSPGKPNFLIDTQGVAVEGATPLSDQSFPLVILSHGYRGWASHFSNLAENLASKGYVVAAIDHKDASFDSVRTFQMSFGNVMLDRAQDQRQIISQIVSQAKSRANGVVAQIDPDKIGLIGYSMGGFGALATAGAPYDATSKTLKALPASALRAMTDGQDDVSGQVKALVTLAPWGTQPENRSWSATDLAKIKAPILMIAGDHDDVVEFKNGVSWAFGQLTGSDRHLLVYKEARHNIAGNPVPIGPDTDFSTLEFFTEPVWRTERLNQINQHFITAFLDMTLKGDTSKAAFLDVPVPNAGSGDWPSAPGEQLGGRFASTAQPKHWRGFQRRWAIGLEMHQARKGDAGTPTPVFAQP
jgi:predicted dienelactone hydrolase